MKDTLKISILQTDIAWEAPHENRARLQVLLDELPQTDVAVLPETFSTGVTKQPAAVAEPPDGPTVQWLRERAAAGNFAITGSLVVASGGKIFNRLVWVAPDGKVQHYDKRHLFPLADEDKAYDAGSQRPTFEYLGWKIRPLICYDLRFPVWSRNDDGYHLALYVADWPARRKQVWRTLLQARALENQCFVAGCNRVGSDAYDVGFSGDSGIWDARGNILADATPSQETVITATLDKNELLAFRKKFAVLEDAHPFRLL